MNKSFLFWSILVLTSAACGCTHNDPVDEICVPRCADSLLVTCDADGNAVKTVCKNGCDGMVCKEDSSQPVVQCTPGCADNLQITCDESGNAIKTVCKNGCSGTVCKEDSGQPVVQCTPGCADNLQITCDENGNAIKTVCKNGCNGLVCNEDPVQPVVQCTPGCADNLQITCDENGNAIKTVCKNGCEGSVCKADEEMDGLLCRDELCANGGKCEKGICVTEKMKTSYIKVGQDYCVGDILVSDYGDVYDCSNDGGCALHVRANSDGGKYLEADCRGIGADKCQYEGQIVTTCNPESAYTSGAVCISNVDGTFYLSEREYYDVSDKSPADGVGDCESRQCNESKTKCVPVKKYCEGNVLVRELNGKILSIEHCYGTCRTINSEPKCVESCNPKDMPVPEYQCDGELLTTNACIPDDNGDYYRSSQIDTCSGGCADFVCHQKDPGVVDPIEPVENDELCNWNTYVPHCDNNEVVRCYRGYVDRNECGREDRFVPGFTSDDKLFECAVVQGKVGCYQKCLADAPTEPKKMCDDGSFYDDSAALTVSCVRSDDANDTSLYASVDVISCSYRSENGGCDDATGTCVKLIDEEYSHCDVMYQAKCQGNIAVECDDDRYVKASVCDEDEVCVVDGSRARCEKLCLYSEELTFVCADEYTSYAVVCEQMGDKWIDGSWMRAEMSCAHGCDSETGKCRLLTEKEGEFCLPSQKIDHCDGNTVVTCQSYFVTAYPCSDDEVCVVDNGFASCEEPCDEEYDHSSCAEYGESYADATIDMCKKSDNDRLYRAYYHMDCGNRGCDETASHCKKIMDTDDQPCSNTPSECKGDVMVYCSNGHMTSHDCSKEGYSCFIDEYSIGCE